MYIRFIIQAVFLANLAQCQQLLKQPCSSSQDCLPTNSHCNRWETYSKGECQCLPGYRPIGVTNCTLRVVRPPSATRKSSIAAKPKSSRMASEFFNRYCASDFECDQYVPNSICKPSSPACRQPTRFCACRDGYLADGNQCWKMARIDEPCDFDTICTDLRTACNPVVGKCTCDMGSKPHPLWPSVCISADASLGFGEKCTRSDECFDDFECNAGSCLCKVGFRYDRTQRRCVANDLGDECAADDDCFSIRFSQCSLVTSTCECMEQYHPIVVNIQNETKAVCLPVEMQAKLISESCVNDENDPIDFNYCRPPLKCTACRADGSESVCALPNVLQPSTTTTQFPTTIPVKNEKLMGDRCLTDQDCNAIVFGRCDIGGSNLCACQPGFIPFTDDVCYPKPETSPMPGRLGDACRDNRDCGSIVAGVCILSTCQCPPLFTKTDDFTCALQRKARLGDDCSKSRECQSIENAVCKSGYCLCRSGFFAIDDSACLSEIDTTMVPDLPLKLGEFCSNHADCKNIDEAICRNQTCQCRPDFVRYSDYACFPEPKTTFSLKIGDACVASLQCLSIENGICQSGVCSCKENFQRLDEYVCIENPKTTSPSYRILGDFCLVDVDCSAIYGATCLRQRCQCQLGFVRHDDRACQPDFQPTTTTTTTTERSPLVIGSACNESWECQSVMNAVCQDGECRCRRGYSSTSPKLCVRVNVEPPKIGSDCKNNTNCKSITNAECRLGNCQCTFGFVSNGSFECIPVKLTIGSYCRQNGDCQGILNGHCQANVCQCLPGFSKTSERICLTSVETTEVPSYVTPGPCVTDVDCKSPNTYCDSEGFCLCKAGFQPEYYDEVGHADSCSPVVVTLPPTQPSKPNIAGGCSSDLDCSHIPKAICSFSGSSFGVCNCSTGFLPAGTDKCMPSGSPVVPETFLNLGDSCTSNEDCQSIPQSLCFLSRCFCKPGYSAAGTDRCLPSGIPELPDDGSLGDFCVTTENCSPVAYAECFQSRCSCQPGYSAVGTNLCAPRLPGRKANIGDECFENENCSSIDHAICEKSPAGRTCQCGVGFKPAGTDRCHPAGTPDIGDYDAFDPKVGDACTSDEDCAAISNTECVLADQKHWCQCQPGYWPNKDYNRCDIESKEEPEKCKNRKCVLGAKCRPGVDDCPEGAGCINGVCLCANGYGPGLKNDCLIERNYSRIGEGCLDSSNCYYNLQCGWKGRCGCSPGQKAIGDYDCNKRQLDDACKTDLDCYYIKNGACHLSKCSCKPYYYKISMFECQEKIVIQNWTKSAQVNCESDFDCIGPNVPRDSKCIRSMCQCPWNAHIDPDGRCRYNSPTDYTGWSCTYNYDCPSNYYCYGNECQFKKLTISSSSTLTAERIFYLLVTLSTVFNWDFVTY